MKKITDKLYVGPLVTAAEIRRAAAEGITAVINNRPDGEEAGQPELGVVRQVLDDHRRAGLKGAAARRGAVDAERRRADHARLPADAGLDQEIPVIRAIAHHLDALHPPEAGHLRRHMPHQPPGRRRSAQGLR